MGNAKRPHLIKFLVLSLVLILLSICIVQSMPVMGQTGNEATFIANELLGRPTDSSVTINAIVEQPVDAYFEYGTQSGVYTNQTNITAYPNGGSIEQVISGLQNNTHYYYRMVYRLKGSAVWIFRNEHSFQTQRPPNSTFTFTLTSDSHMGFPSTNANLFRQALNNVQNDRPDFHLDLGDTFLTDNLKTADEVNNVYLSSRSFFGIVGNSAPVFMVLGNHENEEGWHADDPINLPLFSVNARKQYYLNPIPDRYYSGSVDASMTAIDGDHLRENYFAWKWGDALFVCIDPFWYTTIKPYTGPEGSGTHVETVTGDRWSWTLGWEQYQWFKQTLEQSDAKYKFVFAHHITGGMEGYVRGAAYPAALFEWGGLNADNTWGFDDKRPGWIKPIHQLMLENGVTAFFHGHDHFYAMEQRDNIEYQGIPMPSDFNYGMGFYTTVSYPNAIVRSNSGHIRVTVSPSIVTVDYVRASLVGGNNGQVAHTYTMPLSATPTPTQTPTPSPTPPPTIQQTTTPQPPTPQPTPKKTPTPTLPAQTLTPSATPTTPPTTIPTTIPKTNATTDNLRITTIVAVVIAIGTTTGILVKKYSKHKN